ncbi:MAG: deaminase, partial [Anderseniella sp.]
MTKVELHPAMARAFEEAQAAGERGEVPVGACVTGPDGAIIASAGNRTRELNDATAHAEILVIREAG